MISRAAGAGVVTLVVAGLATLILSGCGGPSESAARLRAQATRVCTAADDAGARIKPPAVPAGTGRFLRRGIAVLRSEIAGLRTLRTPTEQAGAYSAAVAALGREEALLIATARDLDRGADPLTTIKPLQHRLAPVEADGDAAWRTLDVPACVSR